MIEMCGWTRATGKHGNTEMEMGKGTGKGRDAQKRKPILAMPHESWGTRLSHSSCPSTTDWYINVCVATYLPGENPLCLYTDMKRFSSDSQVHPSIQLECELLPLEIKKNMAGSRDQCYFYVKDTQARLLIVKRLRAMYTSLAQSVPARCTLSSGWSSCVGSLSQQEDKSNDCTVVCP